jgi:hypothetical protein
MKKLEPILTSSIIRIEIVLRQYAVTYSASLPFDNGSTITRIRLI